MAPKRKARTAQEVGTFSQAPQRVSRTSRTSPNMRNRGNIPNPLGLTHPKHIARYNNLSCKLVVATCYYDEDFFTNQNLGLVHKFAVISVGCLLRWYKAIFRY